MATCSRRAASAPCRGSGTVSSTSLASLLQGGSPRLLDARRAKPELDDAAAERSPPAPTRRRRERRDAAEPPTEQHAGRRARRLSEDDTETYRIAVGYVHGVKPGNVVGAIANVAGLEGPQIGHVDIREDDTYVGLPRGMPDEVPQELCKARVAGQLLRLTVVTEVPPKPLRKPPKRGTAHAITKRSGSNARDRHAPVGRRR